MSASVVASREAPTLVPLDDGAVAGLTILPSGVVNLRRDLYLFVDFVRREGIRRSYRGNEIPKSAAVKLAKILSWSGEAETVASEKCGVWSDFVSHLARELGLVTFDVKGKYAGHSSTEPSFPENAIALNDARWAAWLAEAPAAKEKAILEALVSSAESELFAGATVVPGRRFDSFGCAVGAASRMDLPRIRGRLLELLAELPAGSWLPMRGLIDSWWCTKEQRWSRSRATRRSGSRSVRSSAIWSSTIDSAGGSWCAIRIGSRACSSSDSACRSASRTGLGSQRRADASAPKKSACAPFVRAALRSATSATSATELTRSEPGSPPTSQSIHRALDRFPRPQLPHLSSSPAPPRSASFSRHQGAAGCTFRRCTGSARHWSPSRR
jgi:hypothetical protein